MGFIGLLNHLLNFAWPALALAVVMPLVLHRTRLGRTATTGLIGQMGVLALVNLLVLLAGLLWFGRDGRMATYLTMAVACASTTWLLLKAWRP